MRSSAKKTQLYEQRMVVVTDQTSGDSLQPIGLGKFARNCSERGLIRAI